MRISQQFPSVHDALPTAALALQNIDGVTTYHESYGVRHPLASYNVSLASVARRIRHVLDILAKTQQELKLNNREKSDWDVPLMEATDHMLDALMEHIDDTSGILRSFFPSSDDKCFKKIHNEYKQSIKPYRKHIGSIVNYIKHNQGRLRALSFIWPTGSSLGYFVEGPTSEGGLGPVSDIHPTENTAFSYYRDIPYHICCLFAVSTRLANALHTVDHRIVPVTIKRDVIVKDSDLSQVLTLTASLPLIYFEDELKKGVPLIQEKHGRISIDYPASKTKPKIPPPGSQIVLSYRGDGVTRTFKMPYFDEKS